MQTPPGLPSKTEAPGLYADFAPRALAFLVDFLLLFSPLLLLARALGLQVTNWPLAAILCVLIAALYCIPFECSRLMATPGKWLLGLRVTDLTGRRIGPLPAAVRYFGKLLSALILFIGFQMVEWTPRRQALHDTLAGTCVVRAARLKALQEGRALTRVGQRWSNAVNLVTAGLLGFAAVVVIYLLWAAKP